MADLQATSYDRLTLALSTGDDLEITGSTSNIQLTTAGKMTLGDDLVIGRQESGQYICLTAYVDGSGDPGIRYDKTNGKWQFSNNGTTWTDM